MKHFFLFLGSLSLLCSLVWVIRCRQAARYTVLFVCPKVCQWIAGKVTVASTPSTSPVPCSSPSPSASDWMRSHTGRASPVRNSHGKNMPSTSSHGSQSEQTTTSKSTPKHTDMAELAKHVRENTLQHLLHWFAITRSNSLVFLFLTGSRNRASDPCTKTWRFLVPETSVSYNRTSTA